MRHALMPASSRRAPHWLALFAFALLASPPARAQSCHGAGPEEHDGSTFRVSARAETAAFATSRYEGHYQGLVPGFLVASEAISAEASLPFYRILRNGLASSGPGDVALAGRARLLASGRDRGSAGVTLGLMLPTGDPDEDLGMGHVMAMPGAWGRVRFRPFLVHAELAYGTALGASAPGHQHHAGGESPIVDPMNRTELEPLVAATLELTRTFGARGGAFGGFPIGSSEGTSRAAAFLGLDVARDFLRARVQGQLPLVGDPFTSKLVLELAASF